MHNPPLRVTALSAGEFKDRLAASPSGQSLLALAGAPAWRGRALHRVRHRRRCRRKPTPGALMVPTGGAAGCGGARPVVLYAHGTTTDRAYNIADITEPARPAPEGSLLAAMYAAQGFIVVAPNYAGYDVSKLGYHPT